VACFCPLPSVLLTAPVGQHQNYIHHSLSLNVLTKKIKYMTDWSEKISIFFELVTGYAFVQDNNIYIYTPVMTYSGAA
jgi:hypothetical protein